jgi:hypothetical protein
VTVVVEKGGRERALVLLPANVHPISYTLAFRDFTPLGDVDGRLALADVALEREQLALARRELLRAEALAPGRRGNLRRRQRELHQLRARLWMENAAESARMGDRERAALLYAMSPVCDAEQDAASRVALDALRADLRSEQEGLDDVVRAKSREALVARVERTTVRVTRRLERARARLARALDAATPASHARRAFAAADHDAQQVEILLRADALRIAEAQAGITWPEPGPEALLREARSLRGEIARSQAVAEVAAGRFELGHRLARVARALGADEASVKAVLQEAERGMMRRGVRSTTPPPEGE